MVDILGTGLTLDAYDWENNNYKWGLSQYRNDYKKKPDLLFAMHIWQDEKDDDVIGLKSYPVQDIIKWSSSNYFTSSISYMIAYALYIGQRDINIYGVEMDSGSEYGAQRACVCYWVGFGRALGARIKVISGLSEPAYLYGYDTEMMTATLNNFESRKIGAWEKAKNTEGRERDQWIGAAHTYEKIIENIRS